MKLTTSAVARIPHPETGQKIYMDDQLKGFGLLVGAKTKTYIAQRTVKGRTVRVTIGRVGVFKAEKARHEAIDLLARMTKGEDPNATRRAEKARGITLRGAADLYLKAPKKRSEKTLKGYRDTLDRYFEDWKDKPLLDIGRKTVYDRHIQIGRDHGTYAANGAMRVFRAIWNRAMRQHEELPVCPTINVDWYPEYPRKAAVTVGELPGLYQRIMTLENPIRRDYFLFVLFSGMRREAAAAVRWREVDFDKAMIHVPNPKGGSERAFDLPLSDYLVDLLRARKACQLTRAMFGDSEWVFPAQSRSGYVSEPKEADLPGPHALRHTYVTAANAAGLSQYDIKLLTNHALPRNDVTAGYIGAGPEELRPSQQRVSEYLMEACGL